MDYSNTQELKQILKEMIVQECEKEFEPCEISDEEKLFGSDSRLELDSLDALQISLALNKNFGINTTDSKKLRSIMVSINSLAKYIEENR